jgi:hypothetical protein
MVNILRQGIFRFLGLETRVIAGLTTAGSRQRRVSDFMNSWKLRDPKVLTHMPEVWQKDLSP